MKKYLIFGCIVLFIWACNSAEQEPNVSGSTTDGAPTASTEKAPKAVNGEKIYKQYCVTCHGLYGDMGASGAYNLTVSELSLEERIAVIKNGRNTMSSFDPLLEDEEIKAVAEYTQTLYTGEEE